MFLRLDIKQILEIVHVITPAQLLLKKQFDKQRRNLSVQSFYEKHQSRCCELLKGRVIHIICRKCQLLLDTNNFYNNVKVWKL